MIVKLVILQVLAAGGVIFLLKVLLDRELVSLALQHLAAWNPPADRIVTDVRVVTASPCPVKAERSLKAIFREKCPQARVCMDVVPAIGGGVAVSVDENMFDFTLMTRIKYLWGKK